MAEREIPPITINKHKHRGENPALKSGYFYWVGKSFDETHFSPQLFMLNLCVWKAAGHSVWLVRKHKNIQMRLSAGKPYSAWRAAWYLKCFNCMNCMKMIVIKLIVFLVPLRLNDCFSGYMTKGAALTKKQKSPKAASHEKDKNFLSECHKPHKRLIKSNSKLDSKFRFRSKSQTCVTYSQRCCTACTRAGELTEAKQKY